MGQISEQNPEPDYLKHNYTAELVMESQPLFKLDTQVKECKVVQPLFELDTQVMECNKGVQILVEEEDPPLHLDKMTGEDLIGGLVESNVNTVARDAQMEVGITRDNVQGKDWVNSQTNLFRRDNSFVKPAACRYRDV